MKKIKTRITYFFMLLLVVACTDDLRDISFVDNIVAPSNVSATFNVSQDNTGTVTITPSAEGAVNFDVYFDDTVVTRVNITQGESVEHVYAEGVYTVKVVAFNMNGDGIEVNEALTVSFKAPENLVVTLENDAAISKQVNISATADYASMYEFYSGETGVAQPVVSGNIGNTIAYQYEEPGTYIVKVVAKGGAIETTEYTTDFEVTEILAPTTPAASPQNRDAEDVVSIFSDQYTDVNLDELPTVWSSSGFEATIIDDNNIWKLANLDFIGMVTNYANGIDISSMEKMHVDYWVPEGTTNELLVKIVNTVDGGEAVSSLGTTAGGSWQSVEVDITAFDGGNLSNKNKITQILIDSDGLAGIVYIDNFYFYKASTNAPAFDDGLLTNGDFENGSDSWLVGVDDASAAPVVTVGGNSYYSMDVTSAGNAYEVNTSQKVEIIQGNTYTLTFDAWSNTNRTILAGIGLSGPPWDNTAESVGITATRATYKLTHVVGFGATDARILFDLGAEVGLVNIDNVSLVVGLGNLLTNGDFENGSDSWLVGVDDASSAPVVTVAGNTYYSTDVTSAGNAYEVNTSQKVEIISGKTYTLTFDAWSNVERTILGGIGLSGPPWDNTAESVSITTTRKTYTLTHVAGFGAPDARVLFDLGAEVGVVNIDDVYLSSN